MVSGAFESAVPFDRDVVALTVVGALEGVGVGVAPGSVLIGGLVAPPLQATSAAQTIPIRTPFWRTFKRILDS